MCLLGSHESQRVNHSPARTSRRTNTEVATSWSLKAASRAAITAAICVVYSYSLCTDWGSVANSVFTSRSWGARAGPRLDNQRLSAGVVTGNRAEKCLYFEFATEPPKDVDGIAMAQSALDCGI